MANSRKSTSQTSEGQKTTPFVNYDLSSDDKAALKAAKISAAQCLAEVYALTKEGYKVTFGWDDYSECMAVWLIGQSEKCPNHGFILTARANDPLKALASVLYKHTSVFAGVWHDRAVAGRPTDEF